MLVLFLKLRQRPRKVWNLAREPSQNRTAAGKKLMATADMFFLLVEELTTFIFPCIYALLLNGLEFVKEKTWTAKNSAGLWPQEH